jgi:hypothetical protein
MVTDTYPTDETLVHVRTCSICGRYVSSARINGINKALVAHERSHVAKGEATREKTWVNNRRGGGHVEVWFKKVEK